MAKSLANSIDVDVTCTSCDKTFKQTIGKLQTNPEVQCPHCGQRIQVRYESDGGIEKLDKSLADLRKAFGKFGKR